MYKKSASIDLSVDLIKYEFHEGQVKPKVGVVMTPQNGTTIDLTVTTASVPMSMDNTDN